MKSSVSVPCSWLKRAIFACSCGCALCCRNAAAQGRALEPELWLPPAASPTADRAGSGANEHPDRRVPRHVQFGALVGVSFPRPLAVEGMVKLEQLAALGLDYSSLPQIGVSGVQL